MVEYLKGLQIRKIRIRPELKDVYLLDGKIFEALRELVKEGKVKGAYFTHQYNPEEKVEPHLNVGIRYEKTEDLTYASSMLDSLRDEHKNLVLERGKFESTKGLDKDLPSNVVVDYLFCHLFEFLPRIKEELGNEPPHPDRMADFLMKHVQETMAHVVNATDIFREDEKPRTLSPNETFSVWVRFVHCLNASQCGDYCEVWRILTERGFIA